MKNFILKSIVLLISLVVISCSQRNYNLTNLTWDAYIVDEKNGDTTNNYFITYTFNSDGTFTESNKFRDFSKIEQKYKKTWKLNGNILTIKLVRYSDGIQRVTKHPLTWLNKSLFFTIEDNEVTGVRKYVYCYAR